MGTNTNQKQDSCKQQKDLTSNSKPLDSASLIYATLRHEILDLAIKPGKEIIESEICERFSASRTPVREAFQRLQSAGLITTIPYKGSIASLLDYDAIQQVIFMRGTVEAAVLTDFIAERTPYQIEELRYRMNLQRILLENDFEPLKFYKADSAFHAIWFRHQKKELVWKIIQKSQLQYSRFRMLDLDSEQTSRCIFDEHEKLFEFIEEKNTTGAAYLIKSHLQGGINRIGERLTKDYSSYFKHNEL